MAERVAPWLALRMLTHSANGFARFVTWVSFSGLALGVMVLTVVVTVMNGFDHELKARLLGSLPHVTLAGAQNDDAVRSFVADTLADDGDAFAYFQGAGGVTGRGTAYPIALYGVPAQDATRLQSVIGAISPANLRALQNDPAAMVLGAPLARAIGAGIGDSVVVVMASTADGRVRPRVLRFVLAGTFTLAAEPDYTLGFVSLQRFPMAEWSTLGEVGMQIQLREPLLAGQVAQRLGERFPEYPVASWERTYGDLFRAVQLEKSMMFVLLLLVVAIAAFNIVAGQSMLVNDKVRSIAILRTLGCTQGMIRNTFLLQGGVISLTGTTLGLVLGLLVAFNIDALLQAVRAVTGMHLLDGSFFVAVPVQVLPLDLLLIGGLSVAL